MNTENYVSGLHNPQRQLDTGSNQNQASNRRVDLNKVNNEQKYIAEIPAARFI
jgi:hypothetical protein